MVLNATFNNISSPCLQFFYLLDLRTSKSVIVLAELKITRPKEKTEIMKIILFKSIHSS